MRLRTCALLHVFPGSALYAHAQERLRGKSRQSAQVRIPQTPRAMSRHRLAPINVGRVRRRPPQRRHRFASAFAFVPAAITKRHNLARLLDRQ